MPRTEAGQATIEWSAVALIVALALGALGYVHAPVAAWRLGDAVVDTVVCAAGGSCGGSLAGTPLEDAYGEELARTVSGYTPNIVYERGEAGLPVDFRLCRRVACSDGPDRRAEVGRSNAGLPVTAFTRIVDRRGDGGALYLQYWFYYPESFTGRVGRVLGPLSNRWPGYHPDDWEGYQVRIGPGGAVSARATAHGRYKSFKYSNGWGPWTGWYRVSGGSHAGHLVIRPGRERTTPAAAVELVPLETLHSPDRYSFEVSPPWRKAVYNDPESQSS